VRPRRRISKVARARPLLAAAKVKLRSNSQLKFVHALGQTSTKYIVYTSSHAAVMQAVRSCTAAALQGLARRQCYSTATNVYASTVHNLRINSDTKVIYQGFTGKQGTYVIADLNP